MQEGGSGSIQCRVVQELKQQCKKAFRKDMSTYEEADEYCPHCDNQYVRVDIPSLLFALTSNRSSRQRSRKRCWEWRARMLVWMPGASTVFAEVVMC